MRGLLFVLLFLPLVACAGEPDLDTPEGAAAAWLEAHEDEDEAALLKCIVDTERRAIQKGHERAEEAGRKQPEFKSNVTDYVVHDATISGNRAVVNITVTRRFGSGEKQLKEKVVCLKEKKQWKVSQAGTKAENRRPIETSE